MASPKEVLVITTSTAEGLTVKKYLKPVSAHLVAGTGLMSDFLGGLSDVFGGRSGAYQKQLASLYTEAIDNIKVAAYEVGANCVIGLNIDMDEISGKGKSMFMISAIGTAVIIEKPVNDKPDPSNEKLENVSVERINILREKINMLAKANAGTLFINDGVWDFFTTNQVDEAFPFLLKAFSRQVANSEFNKADFETYKKHFLSYIEALPHNTVLGLFYDAIEAETSQAFISQLIKIVDELNLFDFERVMHLLKSDSFQAQKAGLHIATCDQPFYNSETLSQINSIRKYLDGAFGERGKRSMKKQLLSSKEKGIWTCECGKSADIGVRCSCGLDIYGFKETDVSKDRADQWLKEKTELISHFI